MRMTEKIKTIAIVAIPVLFSAFVLFYNLGDRMLWGDEAETALLSINITKFGVPMATDGENYITLLGKGIDTNSNDIWVWRPWLDEYITAASFILFGKTTTAARLPFVSIAFISVMFLAFMAHRFYRKNEVTLFATLLFVTNVAFILHARQCRYYALVCLAQMILIYGYHRLLIGDSKSGILFFAPALIVEFYCNYILVLPNILTITIFTLAVYRKHPHLIRNVLIGLVIFSLSVVPWILYAQPWHQAGYMGFKQFAANLLFCILQINFNIVPIVVLLPAVMYFTRRGQQRAKSQDITEKSTEVFLWSLVPAHLLILSVTPSFAFRYLIPLIPVFILLLSIIIVDYVRPRFLQYLLVAILSLSNIIPVLTAYPIIQSTVRMPIIQFLSEITSEYDNKLADVVHFLRSNARPEETLFVPDPEFPVIFYTGMRVIDARLNPLLYANNLPDWIFPQSTSGTIGIPELKLPEALENDYELIVLPVHDSPYGDSCPEPEVHASFTSDKLIGFKIYKKSRPHNN
jgi:hypothetical protein